MKSLIKFGRTTTKRDFLESIGIGIVLTTLSYIVALLAGWINSLDTLEVFAVLTAYSSTYLCVKERRINYLAGMMSTAAYAYLFIQSGLLASAILNIYLTPTLIYGWFRWRKDSNTRPVKHLKLKTIPVYALITIAGYMGAALLSQTLGGSLAWADATILTGSILAQFLLDNKRIETWGIWAIVNVFAISTYASAGLWLVAVQYVFFLANTAYGYITWQHSMKQSTNLVETEVA